jgi:hypothetical protein
MCSTLRDAAGQVRAPPVTRVMTDFAACRWPEFLDAHTDSVARCVGGP